MVHRKVYVVLLCLLAAAMTTSVFFANLFWFLLFVNWVTEWNWHEKFADFRSNRLLHAFIVLFVVYLLWMLLGGNWGAGLREVQTVLPLMAIPLVVLTTPRLDSRERYWVILLYVLAVLVVSVIGWVRWQTMADLPYREIVPYISHIRFSLNVCLVICLLLSDVVSRWHRHKRDAAVVTFFALLIVFWLLYFLLLIRSYTAFAVLTCIAFAAGIRWFLSMRRWQGRTAVIVAFLVVAGAAAVYVSHLVSDYYRPTPLEQQPMAACTAHGNLYSHANDGLIENGSQVNNYVCEPELRAAWPMVSAFPIDSLTPNGYSVYPTLLRYLNSRGLPKDSAGVTSLTPNDVAAIEKGIANRVYVNGSPIRKMVYVLLFEYENYRVNHTLKNSSVGERILLWQNGWQVFLQHPMLGVGTCNAFDACKERLQATDSPLKDTRKCIHNQYLTWLVTFGGVGVLLIVYAFGRAALLRWQSWRFLSVAYLLIILLSCLTEDTLATLAGILLCTVPLSFLRHP